MKIKFSYYFIYIYFLIYLIIGFNIYKNYGINIEEHLQRWSGLYWLDYTLSFTNWEELKRIVELKLNQASDPYLPDIKTYGIFFDLPVAFVEAFFNIKSSKTYFELRHLLNFLIFYLSSIYFFKIINLRFNRLDISLISTSFYIISPRIFGDSFHNNKDILFLSLITFALYFMFKYFKDKKKFTLIIFAFLCAISTSTRMMGVFVPVLFIIFSYFDNYKKKEIFIKEFVITISFYLIFLLIHWPYLWANPINNLKFLIFNPSINLHPLYILFNGKYYLTTQLPDYYLLFWIVISYPISYLLLNLAGIYFLLLRFFNRLTKINEEKVHKDLWRGNNEKFDNFCLVSLLGILFIASTFYFTFIGGWRHFYFLHFFLIYIIAYLINFIYIKYKIKNLIYLVSIICIVFSSYQIFKFHPFESLYLNNIISNKSKNNFQIDMPALSRAHALKTIYKDSDNKKINIANASFVPFKNGADLLDDNIKEKFKFVGNEYDKADYIYTNLIYEIDISYNDKYNIPNNFILFKSLSIDSIDIYKIYKKRN